MPCIHITQLFKLETIHKYIGNNINRCKNNIKTFTITIQPNKKSVLSVSYENGEFTWEDDEGTFLFCLKKEGQPCPREHAYFLSLTISHDDIDALQKFVTRMLLADEKLSIYMSNSNGYWTSYDIKSRNANKINNIFLPSKIIDDVCREIDTFNKPETKTLYDELGDVYKRVFLLAGIPGSGKSSLIKALAAKYKRSTYYLNFSKKLLDDVMAELMNRIVENSILVIEDIDSYFGENGDSDINVTQSMLLNILDGANDECLNNVLVFITANNLEQLDYRLKRPGRIHKIYKFDYPERHEIEGCFKRYVTKPDADFKEFYNKIKSHKICMAGIKEYLISHLDNYMEDIDEFIRDMNERPTRNNTDKMFM